MKTSLFMSFHVILVIGIFAGGFNCADAQGRPVLDSSDIRNWAPPKPGATTFLLVSPEAGTDLRSVSADWARREVHLVSGGADEKFLADTNAKLDRLFRTSNSIEESSVPAGVRRPASDDRWLRPRTVHMSRLGEIEIGFNGRAKISCDLAGGNGTELILSKPVSTDLDVQLHHETNSNSLQFRLNW